MSIQGEPAYCADNQEILLESLGPAGGGPYTLVFEVSKKRLKHAQGDYETHEAAGVVNDIRFPSG
jgi:hypothetical protein